VLALVYRDRPYVVDSSRETYEIGRNPTSFIVVNNDKVSRLHATIVAKDGKYVLSDQSRNGTTVKLGDQPPVVLNRQSMTLEATGVIGLGVDAREIGNDEMVLISFRLN
jgi:pSer/pThr/pTyr-binding forkhead associated (FHA) protein